MRSARAIAGFWAVLAGLWTLAGCDLSALERYDAGLPIIAEPDAGRPVPEDGGELSPDAEADGSIADPPDGGDAAIIEEDASAVIEPVPITAEALPEFTTTNNSFVDVPGAELTIKPDSADQTWIVFASGRIRSDSFAGRPYEVSLNVDGNNVDRFNHQTTGMSENWAGFLTFYPITGDTVAHTVKLRIRTIGGNQPPASIADVRLVAAPLPPNADFHWAEATPNEERLTGTGLPVAKLDFQPSSGGDYYIFARTEQSASPGGFSVRTRLNDSSAYSNSSDAMQPTFFAKRETLEASPQSFTLWGASSGSFDASAWWNRAYDSALPVTVTAPETAIPIDYVVSAVIDHQQLVRDGTSAMDGSDLRVVYFNGTDSNPIPFALDPDSEWGRADTKIWFKIVADIPPRAEDSNYAIYHSGEVTVQPADDPWSVFWLYDDFDGATFDSATWNSMGASIDTSLESAVISQGTSLMGQWFYDTGVILEARLSAEVDFLMAQDASLLSLSTNSLGTEDYLGFALDGAQLVARSRSTTQNQEAIMFSDFAGSHVYAIARGENLCAFAIDDALSAFLGAALPGASMYPLLGATSDTTIFLEWIRLRPFALMPPVVRVDPDLHWAGTEASTWRSARIVAFRADAFDRAVYDEEVTRQTYSGATPRTRNTLDAPPGGRGRDYLVIQSARIGGAPDDQSRKSGVLLVDGNTVMETSHKIGLDSSELGYHHTAGFAGVVRGAMRFTAENSYRSPDGIAVEIDESVIIILRYRNGS